MTRSSFWSCINPPPLRLPVPPYWVFRIKNRLSEDLHGKGVSNKIGLLFIETFKTESNEFLGDIQINQIPVSPQKKSVRVSESWLPNFFQVLALPGQARVALYEINFQTTNGPNRQSPENPSVETTFFLPGHYN